MKLKTKIPRGMINSISKMFCCSKKKIKNIEEVQEYPNDWFYMIKRGDGPDEYWWWNKRTDEVSKEKPETFDRELTTYKSDSDDESDSDTEIVRDYGDWKFMRSSTGPNNVREWWWNPVTAECQFTVPDCIDEIVV